MEKRRIIVKFVSKAHHCSQVITGFKEICKKYGILCVIEDHSQDNNYPYKGTFVEVEWEGLSLVYDMNDGYQNLEAMRWFLNKSDYYFKRSYSKEYNVLIANDTQKIHPYGFNYFVTFKGNPLDGPYYKEIIKAVLRQNRNTIFTPNAFEEIPSYTENPKVLFSVRLWPYDYNLSEALNYERKIINDMRIKIVRALKDKYRDNFYGGLYDTELARISAPELIIPNKQTLKSNYLKTLHMADICVGTMGLHESIGGKTGEYIAAAKGVVLERLHYSVTGDFFEGKNYLSFETEVECLDAVDKLYSNPAMLYRMKVENAIYYQQYLRPDSLITHTLNIAGIIL